MTGPRIVQFDELKLLELIERSHQAVAEVQSRGLGEIKTDIALIKQNLEHIKEDNSERNGKFARAVEMFSINFKDDRKDIKELQIALAGSAGSSKSNSVWIAAIVSLIVAIIAAIITAKL